MMFDTYSQLRAAEGKMRAAGVRACGSGCIDG